MTPLTQHSTAPVRMERLALPAIDGYPLPAYRYHAPGHAHGNLLVAGATGVAQRSYQRFVEHAVRQGFDVLTLDYRGIGEPVSANLKGFAISYLDWVYQDLATAVELLGREERPLYWTGHPFGDHAIGPLLDHGRPAACYSFGSGADWSGWMSRREVLKVRLLRTLVLPPLVAWRDYMAWSLLSMGGDLPLGVYRDQKRWHRHPHYYFDDPAMCHLHQRYVAVRTSRLFATALDDPWAPSCSWDAFVEACRNAPLETLDLRPDGGPLGYMSYFRAGVEALWDDAPRWPRRHPENA